MVGWRIGVDVVESLPPALAPDIPIRASPAPSATAPPKTVAVVVPEFAKNVHLVGLARRYLALLQSGAAETDVAVTAVARIMDKIFVNILILDSLFTQ